jgi:adenylate cyclase class 2
MLEIEIKAYCDDHDSIIKKIIFLNGKFIRQVAERDIYFKHPSRDFALTDEALRIRHKRDISVLTYKGPKLSNRSKTRIEHEIEFSDPDSMIDILYNLGFGIAGEINKMRNIYNINEIEVCLDKVEDLGNFVELEKRSMDKERGEKELFDLADELGLSRFERKSYLELMLEKKENKNNL